MKKYIIPAVDVTAMHVENTVLTTSFTVGSDDIVVGGAGDQSDEGIGQLTNGWSCENWTTSTDE